ncbi:Mu transposase C-terminal domain-containing protein [Micromonospora sp. NPDC048999]|uniref:Mu transposase C-terminal domain-containing protein n=1 Tax=Micromonospora sp. NPDC048999 TaxID=3155391 RepID=UPI00340790C2
MTDRVLTVAPGTHLLFDGDVCEVVELDGTRVVLRNVRTGGLAAAGSARLVTAAQAVTAPADEGPSVGMVLAGLSRGQRQEIAERAEHVREVLTGFRSGHQERAAPGEPDPRFAAEVPLKTRYGNKAAQLGVTARTIERWVAGYREAGEAGLVVQRPGASSLVDLRWDEAARQVLAGLVNASTPTRSAVIARVSAVLAEQFGDGVVPLPSQATAYRRLAELTKGTNAVSGSAKGRRSIAERPTGVYGRLRATRPGEYLILDTQDLDVFAMEPVTCRWVRAQLTVAQDLFTRCIVGLRVTPVSTKAVDVAGVLFEAVAGRSVPDSWPPEAAWPHHGVPAELVFDETVPSVGPVCAPETLVVDHGRVFLSAHVIGVCTRLGISIQPAQPHKPTDKPTVERFFRTLREGLIQHLPAYKGPDLHSRGLNVESEAFLFLHELEDVIREWIATVYHRAKHDGLTIAAWPHLALSPVEMFGAGIAAAGLLRLPAGPDLALDFLPVVARTIQHYGVEINGLRYNGPALNGYRNARSPYRGALAGRWPIRINPDDVRHAWFQDPADQRWHRLDWEHTASLNTPFSADAAAYARRLAADPGSALDPAKVLAQLLKRWSTGMITDRRERRIAARLSAEYVALRPIEPPNPEPDAEAPPTSPTEVDELLSGDDDDADFAGRDDGGFYDDAFEVLT